MTTPSSASSDNVAHALSGAGGGLLSMALTYPLITLSTRAQVESRKHPSTSTLSAARRILSREGLPGLYSGLESALFGITITNFVYYYWYEFTRSAFLKAASKNGIKRTGLGTVESMIAGAVAGCATVIVTNPVWVVNTRMTTLKKDSEETVMEEGKTVEGGSAKLIDGEKHERVPRKTLSTWGTLLKIIKEEGFARLFAGVLPALVLVINPILQYTLFEQLRNALAKRRKVTAKDSFYLGALGKLAATTITYPYITVKSRAHVATGEGTKEGMFASFSRILNEEGWAGLYGGIGPKVTQSVLTAAFLFAFKDALYDATVKARKSIKT